VLALVVVLLIAILYYATPNAKQPKFRWMSMGALNMALLFGAEFDAETERGRQLQAGIAAEENIQLPPRDTKRSEKAAAAEEGDVQRARELREEASGGDTTKNKQA
jgi:membrane protein